ncbi:MAG: hypothetical protein JKY08_11545 [Flavobacteriaceae bacterium]|nr:hypothetical protein [Flavobacteriaceae bacterium]
MLGVNANEFSQLKAKKDDHYLAQLCTYVNYKRKHLKIVSTKNYIFGVINKNPTIEDLLTPNCIVKSKQEKYKLQQKKELVVIEVQRKIQA